MEKIRENVSTAFYLRHVFSYQLRNIEDGTVIIYYTIKGSPWINRLEDAEEWLTPRKKVALSLKVLKGRIQSGCLKAFSTLT